MLSKDLMIFMHLLDIWGWMGMQNAPQKNKINFLSCFSTIFFLLSLTNINNFDAFIF